MPTAATIGHPAHLRQLAAFVAAVASCFGVACSADTGGRPMADRPASVTTVSTTVDTRPPVSLAPPTSTTQTTREPERLTVSSRLSLDGIGPVDVGMTLDQASAAAGVPIRLQPDPFDHDCHYARADDPALAGLGFMVIKGRIERIDVGSARPSPIKTVSGIGTGSTEDNVKRTYGARIQVQRAPYDPNGHYLVYTPQDPDLGHLSMIFETDGQQVTRFRAGLKGAVAQIEGCA